MSSTDFQKTLDVVLADLREFLLEKNRAYGDSASNPIRVFSRASAVEQIDVRIDDKISRLARGHEYPGDDTVRDLLGYLILREVVCEREKTTSSDRRTTSGKRDTLLPPR